MDNTSNTNTGFTLIDKFTIGSIALIGIVFTLLIASDSVKLGNFSTTIQNNGIVDAVGIHRAYLMELVVYFTLAIGSLYLLFSASKTAWILTRIPLFIITIYFSYSILLTLSIGDSSTDSQPLKFLSQGIIITINFILVLFSLALSAKSFRDKLKD